MDLYVMIWNAEAVSAYILHNMPMQRLKTEEWLLFHSQIGKIHLPITQTGIYQSLVLDNQSTNGSHELKTVHYVVLETITNDDDIDLLFQI